MFLVGIELSYCLSQIISASFKDDHLMEALLYYLSSPLKPVMWLHVNPLYAGIQNGVLEKCVFVILKNVKFGNICWNEI